MFRSLLTPLLAFLAIASVAGCSKEKKPIGPNVVILSIDALRPDHLGCYGYLRLTSPNIDAIANGGIVFEQHVSSAPWSLPAHAAMFSSVPDSVHGVVDPIDSRLSSEFDTLAESFRRGGYRTAGFYTGPFLHPSFGLAQGFETYQDCGDTAQNEIVDDEGHWSVADNVVRAARENRTNEAAYARWESFLESAGPKARDGDQPFLAFVQLRDVDHDFNPPAPFDTMFDPDYAGRVTGDEYLLDPAIHASMSAADKRHIAALYDGEIRWTDTFVGKMRADLVALGIESHTIFVVTGAHGIELFEHGGKGHGTSLYDEQIRIPLIIRFPEIVAPGRHGGVTRMIDLAPTLRELCDLPVERGAMGASLAGVVIDDSTERLAPPAISELLTGQRELRAVRSSSDKVIYNAKRDVFFWFDLLQDPAEAMTRPMETDARSNRLKSLYESAAAGIEAGIEVRRRGLEAWDPPPVIERSLGAR